MDAENKKPFKVSLNNLLKIKFCNFVEYLKKILNNILTWSTICLFCDYKFMPL